MPVSKRVRFEVLRRDGHTCRYCGATAPGATLTVDHVVPTALGGTDSPSNLVTACRECNAGKAAIAPDQTLVDGVSADAERWARAMEKAGENARENGKRIDAYLAAVADVVDWYSDREKPTDWRESITQFHNAGLPVESMRRALQIGADKPGIAWDQRWRYACGAAWNMLTELQAEARRIITEQDAER